jgi:hypothetical protein
MIPTGNPDPAPRPKLESGFPAVYNLLERDMDSLQSKSDCS